MPDPFVIDDCWNTIGVQGDKSCPLLEDYIHCRNCHVYEAAAATLMNRSMPAGYQVEWARQFSLEEADQVVKTHSAVVFRVGGEWLALPTSMVTEVAELRSIHIIPHRNSGALAGLTNARGELLICISLAILLDTGTQVVRVQHATATSRPRLLVVSHEGLQVGFPVDAVQGVERYHEGQLGALPATLESAASAYCSAMLDVDERIVGCLDPDLLFKSIARCLK